MKTWKIVGVVTVLMGMAIALQAELIEDFESYADSTALNTDFSELQANTTVTLGASDGVGGGQSMHFNANTWASPWWGGALYDWSGSLDGVTAVDMQIEALTGTHGGNYFKAMLYDGFGTEIVSGSSIAVSSISSSGYQTYSIDTSGVGAGTTVSTVGFFFEATGGNGPSEIRIDNIQTIPEPATLGLLGLSVAVLMFLRRLRV